MRKPLEWCYTYQINVSLQEKSLNSLIRCFTFFEHFQLSQTIFRPNAWLHKKCMYIHTTVVGKDSQAKKNEFDLIFGTQDYWLTVIVNSQMLTPYMSCWNGIQCPNPSLLKSTHSYLGGYTCPQNSKMALPSSWLLMNLGTSMQNDKTIEWMMLHISTK